MPVWMMEHNGKETASGTRQYWIMANGAEGQPQDISGDTVEFCRSRDTEFPVNQAKEAYRVRYSCFPDAGAPDGAALAAGAWKEFLSRHQRWMGDPGGDLCMTVHPVKDLAMEYHMEEVDGWMREWYLYVPDSVRRQPKKPVPLVFALHGYTNTGETYTSNSGWYQVAEDRGFLVIHPTAAPGRVPVKSPASDPANLPYPAWNFLHNEPNGPDEFHFFQVLLERTAAEYAVDRGRVYATGHSHGALMTHALALGKPELFAAVAPCSGIIFEPIFDSFVAQKELQQAGIPVPIWIFVGKEEGWLLDARPALDNATGKTLALWHQRNELAGNVEESFDETRWETHAGRWHEWSGRDNQGRPMIRFTAIDAFPHATMPEMSYRIWDEYFSHWSREGKTLRYV